MLMMLILGPHFENHWSRDAIMGGAWSEAQVKIFEGEEAKTAKNTYKTRNYDSIVLEGMIVRQELRSSRTGRRTQSSVQD